MKIAPRYDGPPIVTLAADARGGGAGVGDAFLRQRRRFLGILALAAPGITLTDPVAFAAILNDD